MDDTVNGRARMTEREHTPEAADEVVDLALREEEADGVVGGDGSLQNAAIQRRDASASVVQNLRA